MNKFKKSFHKHFSTFRSKLTAAFILTSMIPLLLSITIAMFIINSYLKKETINQLISDASLEAQQIEADFPAVFALQRLARDEPALEQARDEGASSSHCLQVYYHYDNKKSMLLRHPYR